MQRRKPAAALPSKRPSARPTSPPASTPASGPSTLGTAGSSRAGRLGRAPRSQTADRPIGGDPDTRVEFALALVDDPIAFRAKPLGHPSVGRLGAARDRRTLDVEGALVDPGGERFGADGNPDRQ